MYWKAIYVDGREITEAKGRYGQLERDQLAMFSILDEDGRIKAHIGELQDGRKLFYRTRVFGVGGPIQSKIVLVGWRRRVDGKIEMEFYRVPEFGSTTRHTEFTGDCYEPKPWFPGEEV